MEARIPDPAPPGSTTTTELPLKPGIWTLDKAHVRVGFAIRHLGIAMVRGSFTDVEAELVVGSTLADTAVWASIDAASIETGNAARDANIRGAAFFDVARRQTVTFRSTAVNGADDRWTLAGDLSIGDVSGPITLDVAFGGVAEGFGGVRHAGFAARGLVHRRDFGLTFGQGDPQLGKVVELQLDLEFIEPD